MMIPPICFAISTRWVDAAEQSIVSSHPVPALV
jgi:hypothetical protein